MKFGNFKVIKNSSQLKPNAYAETLRIKNWKLL